MTSIKSLPSTRHRRQNFHNRVSHNTPPPPMIPTPIISLHLAYTLAPSPSPPLSRTVSRTSCTHTTRT
ncbi:hypothetical protein EYC84_008321 [Monilinia fructicola]|uniref:Uncharacterized protein n=1 Tax=Monilinia fructicola TaxID=38448 RepID=A0A5M9JEY3_MONFR|nr:hypothetical protein EYC84_008321 [Monilinia fructicola]